MADEWELIRARKGTLATLGQRVMTWDASECATDLADIIQGATAMDEAEAIRQLAEGVKATQEKPRIIQLINPSEIKP